MVLIANIFVLWSIFIDGREYRGLALIAVLMLVLRATIGNIEFAQINLLVLLTFLLYWQRRETVLGGVWLGVGMILKPILVIVLIYPIMRRQWLSLLGVVLAGFILSTITIIVFGADMFFGYFLNNPIVQHMPPYLYTEEVNQSLLATILRLTNYDFSGPSVYLQPVFFASALIISGVTALLIYRKHHEKDFYADWALTLTIAYALLIFPKTLFTYSVFLIVPVVMVYTNRKELPANFWLIVVFITTVYVLVSLWVHFVFVAMLITWIFITGGCFRLRYENA
jgi:hypothetical protein